MATYKGTNRTLADTPTESNIMDGGQQYGRVRVITDDYTTSATASGSIIELGVYIPKNSRVVEVVLTTADLGATTTVAVGDYEDADRYITATVCTTANQVTRLNAIGGRQYKVDETTATATGTDRQIIATIGVAAATGAIKVEVYYVQD